MTVKLVRYCFFYS